MHRAYKQNTYTQSNAKVVGSIPTVSIIFSPEFEKLKNTSSTIKENMTDPRIKEWVTVTEVKTYNIDGKITTVETNARKVPVFHTTEEWCKMECKDNKSKDCISWCEYTECMQRWGKFGGGIPQCTFF